MSGLASSAPRGPTEGAGRPHDGDGRGEAGPAGKALLIAPQWIGDAVMAQPLAARLAASGFRVTALALPSVAPLLRASPGIAEVIEARLAHGRLDLGARRALAAALRRQGFDRAYVLGNNVKSRLIPWLARIPRRIGYRGEAAGLLLTEAVAEPRHERRADGTASSAEPHAPRGDLPAPRGDLRVHYAALAGPGPVPEPELRLPEARIRETLEALDLAPGFIALCPGAEYGPAKRWPHFAGAARLAVAEGRRVVLLGAPRDADTAAAIAAEIPGVTDLCGRTSMDQAMALLAAAAGVISNDSGLMHVAAALGTPTVGLYGSTDPRHTPPAARRSTVLWLHLPCGPCFQRTCPLGHLDCLRTIAAESAWDALRALM